MATINYQTVVYGNTWAAVNAALASAEQGASTALVSPYRHIGGIIANGLGAIDLGYLGTRGIGTWWSGEFFRRLTAQAGSRTVIRRTSPSIAEQIFNDMLRDMGVEVWASSSLYILSSVQVNNADGSIVSITTADGTIFTATNFVDGCEEGDVMAGHGGISYTVGREAASQYNESLGGFLPNQSTFRPFNCYANDGVTLINGFSPFPGTPVGGADAAIMAYTFRVCATQNQQNKLDWPKPPNYDENLIEYLVRAIPPNQPAWRPFGGAACIDGKLDINGDYGMPQQFAWANSTPAQRQVIYQNIIAEQFGYLWFLANDPSVDPQVRAYVNSFGPCIDEFPDTGASNQPRGVPYELYVRAARRMIGKYVMTQADTQVNTVKATTIATGFYSLDYHIPWRLAESLIGVPGFCYDGLGVVDNNSLRLVTPGYNIPFECMLPQPAQCPNLMVVRAFSCSSVAQSSMRIDVFTANMGAIAGLACAMSAMSSTPLNSLSVPSIQSIAVGKGQVISYP